MLNKQLIFGLFVFSLFALPLFSQTNVDSLLYDIDRSSGEEKLKLMYKLIKLHENGKNAKALSFDLIEEAKKQGNDKWLTHAYETLSRCYANENNIDSVYYYTKLLDERYQSGDTYMYLTHLYINRGYYDLAIRNLNLMLKNIERHSFKDLNINMLLCIAYKSCGKYDVAEGYALKTWELARELILDYEPNRTIGIYECIIGAFAQNKKFEKALEACLEFENSIEKHSTPNNRYEGCRYLLYYMYGSINVDLKNTEKTKYYLSKMEELPTDNINDVMVPLIDILASDYYLLTGDYGLSLKHLEKSLSYYKEIENRSLVSQLSSSKIEVLEKQNRYKEALDLQKELFHFKDSISQENIPLQIEQISKEYELEKAKIQREKDKAELHKNQITVAGLVILLLLLCTILILVKLNNKKLRKKNKILYQQYENMDKYICHMQLDTNPQNRELSLFEKIQQYLIDEEAFKNPNLNRDDVARAVNTNRQYLTDAIKNERGQTFLEYVNFLRLSYARNQLITDSNIPVSSILYNSGFASSSTFYRLFKEEFGMSPSEMREAKKELVSNIENKQSVEVYE